MSPLPVKITKDRLVEVLRQTQGIDALQVHVGFPADARRRRGNEIDNASLAYIHDKGSPANNIPARPFLEPGVRSVEDQVLSIVRRATKEMLSGDREAHLRGLHQIGVVVVGGVQDKIRIGPFVPLKPATIRRKKSSRPLIDTAQMLQSVTYVIRRRIVR